MQYIRPLSRNDSGNGVWRSGGAEGEVGRVAPHSSYETRLSDRVGDIMGKERPKKQRLGMRDQTVLRSEKFDLTLRVMVGYL